MASPLTGLPEIDDRLAARGAPDQPLERAAELRALLADQITRLKPRDQGDHNWQNAGARLIAADPRSRTVPVQR